MREIKTVTIAIPCYKSEKTLSSVVDGIRKEFHLHSGYDYQIILVNDGSADGTFGIISSLCSEDNHIVGVDLSRNFGQAAAKMAAIPYVNGEILIYMDDDGQHPAKGLFKLIAEIENGADVAIADFQHKKHSVFKRIASKLNSEMLRLVVNKPKHLHNSSFAAYSSFIIDRLREYNSPFISMFAYVLQYTSAIVNVKMPHQDRMEGSSGYTLKKLFRLWSDGIFNFSMVPLRFFYLLAEIMVIGGLLAFLWVIISACLHFSVVVPVVLGCMFFLAGVLMFAMGILGEYVGRVCLLSNGTPQYAVRTVINRVDAGLENV